MSRTRNLARLHSDSDGNVIMGGSLTVDTDTLKVDNANNRVGINHTAPLKSLHVNEAGDAGIMLTTSNAATGYRNWEMQAGADGSNQANFIIRTRADNGTGGDEIMRMNKNGHVGIGTSTPDANSFGAGHGVLAVASQTGSHKTAMLNLIGDGNNTDATRVASLFFNDASATGAGATLAGVEAYRASNHATDPGANLKFGTNSTGNNYTPKMTIAGRGYVNMEYQPCFYAFTSNDPNHTGVNLTSGNGFNWAEAFDQDNNFSGGTFTAPIAGKYYFSVMWNRSVVQSRIAIRKNNNNYMRWEPTGRTDDTWESQQYSVLMQMAANDYVTLYGEYNGSSSHPYHMGTGAWGHFAGYLIA